MTWLWRYMAAPTKHHMSSNTTRRAELACFLAGITVSAAATVALLGLMVLVVRGLTGR